MTLDEAQKVILDQQKEIAILRKALKFCARSDVGTYYQQDVAKTLIEQNKFIEYIGSDGNKI